MAEQPWKTQVHAAIRHPEKPAILVITEAGRRVLPRMVAESFWTSGHPFVDLMMVSWMSPEDADPFLKAYFEPWKEFLGEFDLEETFDLVKVPLFLHHAVSYHQIVRHLEPDSKSELNSTIEFLQEAFKSATVYKEKYMSDEMADKIEKAA